MSDLNIPDAAYDAWIGEVALSGYPLADGDFLAAARVALVAVVPLVVAAELRRIADTFRVPDGVEGGVADNVASMYAHCAQVLRARADELDQAPGSNDE